MARRLTRITTSPKSKWLTLDWLLLDYAWQRFSTMHSANRVRLYRLRPRPGPRFNRQPVTRDPRVPQLPDSKSHLDFGLWVVRQAVSRIGGIVLGVGMGNHRKLDQWPQDIEARAVRGITLAACPSSLAVAWSSRRRAGILRRTNRRPNSVPWPHPRVRSQVARWSSWCVRRCR
jgi:hypothetical protein